MHAPAQKTFLLTISSVNVTKSPRNYGFGHITEKSWMWNLIFQRSISRYKFTTMLRKDFNINISQGVPPKVHRGAPKQFMKVFIISIICFKKPQRSVDSIFCVYLFCNKYYKCFFLEAVVRTCFAKKPFCKIHLLWILFTNRVAIGLTYFKKSFMCFPLKFGKFYRTVSL